MLRRRPFLLACGVVLVCGVMLSCTGRRPQQAGSLREDDVKVNRDPGGRGTIYTVTAGDCSISWGVYGPGVNTGVISHLSLIHI